MNFKEAKVVSHPRAGSHYFAKLLNDNFFNKNNYLELYAGHSSGHMVHLNDTSTAVFYIYRNNTDTLMSMYKLKDRFGIAPKSWEEFLTKPLNELKSNDIVSEAIFNSGKYKKVVTEVDQYLGTFPFTADQFIDEHKKRWLEIERFNYMPVSYDRLKENFYEEMLKIAKFLGSNKTEFSREKQRIGWYDSNEREKNFS